MKGFGPSQKEARWIQVGRWEEAEAAADRQEVSRKSREEINGWSERERREGSWRWRRGRRGQSWTEAGD